MSTERFTCRPLIHPGSNDPQELDHWSFLIKAESTELIAFAQQLAWLAAVLNRLKYPFTDDRRCSQVFFASNRAGPKEFRIAPLTTPIFNRSIDSTFVSSSPYPMIFHPLVDMRIDFTYLAAFAENVLSRLSGMTSTSSPAEKLNFQIMADSIQGEDCLSWALFATGDRKSYMEELSLLARDWIFRRRDGMICPDRHIFGFAVYWDFHKYCDTNLSGNRDISRVPILVGQLGDAFAATCGEYFRQTWPHQGTSLLDFFANAFKEYEHTRKWYKRLSFGVSSLPDDIRIS